MSQNLLLAILLSIIIIIWGIFTIPDLLALTQGNEPTYLKNITDILTAKP